MMKAIKRIPWIVFAVLLLILTFWLCFQYQTNYKITACDTSVSPDGKYSLTLQAVGEPDWPFGTSSGRLVLREGRKKISLTNFALRNDGAGISSRCWAVSWTDDHADVTLSGEEQENTCLRLYYDGSSEAVRQIDLPPDSEVTKLDIGVIQNRENELVFDISIEDFIESYNSFYLKNRGKTYLSPKNMWQKFTYDDAIHSDHKTARYVFSSDEQVLSQPTITVYVPTNADYVQEVTLNLDAHGYSEPFYEEFEELCFYTLKVFFPELEDEKIVSLYQEANDLGGLNVFSREDGYKKGCVPCILYYKNGIGVYPYFAIGEWVHLCIIPVTEETVKDFREKGAEIREIQ